MKSLECLKMIKEKAISIIPSLDSISKVLVVLPMDYMDFSQKN